MAELAAAYLDGGSIPSIVDRLIVESYIGNRAGVIDPLALKCSKGAGNWDIAVASGVVFGEDRTGSGRGKYPMVNDATVTKTLAASDATQARTDLIVARIKDVFYGTAGNVWAIEVVAGTLGAGVPATPNNCVPLAQVPIPAASGAIVGGNIVDLRPRTATAGGTILCTSTTRPGTPTVGQTIYETDTAKELIYAGPTSGWNPPWNQPWGILNYVEYTTIGQSIGGSETPLTGMSFSATLVANRRMRLVAKANANASATSETFDLIVKQGATVRGRQVSAATATGGFLPLIAEGIWTSTAGTSTFTAAMQRFLGSGTVTVQAWVGDPTSLYLEDVGPAGLPS